MYVHSSQVIRENSRLYFVFEYVKGDLLGLMRERAAEPFTEAWIRNVVFQVLQVRERDEGHFDIFLSCPTVSHIKKMATFLITAEVIKMEE